MSDIDKRELATQVVLTFEAAMMGVYGPVAGAAAAAAVPLAVAGLDWFAGVIGRRRLENAADVVADGADAYEAETGGAFEQFIQAAVSDPEHQELLARALTIAQDTAMRDKRRALGRALASAATDEGTKVDTEMLFIRLLDELDAPHIRLLRLMSTPPASLAELNRVQRNEVGLPPIRQWHPPEIAELDPGLGEVMYGLLPVLERLRLIDGNPAEYTINAYGEYVLDRLADPDSGQG